MSEHINRSRVRRPIDPMTAVQVCDEQRRHVARLFRAAEEARTDLYDAYGRLDEAQRQADHAKLNLDALYATHLVGQTIEIFEGLAIGREIVDQSPPQYRRARTRLGGRSAVIEEVIDLSHHPHLDRDGLGLRIRITPTNQVYLVSPLECELGPENGSETPQ